MTDGTHPTRRTFLGVLPLPVLQAGVFEENGDGGNFIPVIKQ